MKEIKIEFHGEIYHVKLKNISECSYHVIYYECNKFINHRLELGGNNGIHKMMENERK